MSWVEGWTNPTSVQQSPNPLNTACPCAHLFREVAILGLYLSLSSPHSLHLCPTHSTKENLWLFSQGVLQYFFFLGWQLNFRCTENFYGTLSVCEYLKSPLYALILSPLLLSLTSSHKKAGGKRKCNMTRIQRAEPASWRREAVKNSAGEILQPVVIRPVQYEYTFCSALSPKQPHLKGQKRSSPLINHFYLRCDAVVCSPETGCMLTVCRVSLQ